MRRALEDRIRIKMLDQESVKNWVKLNEDCCSLLHFIIINCTNTRWSNTCLDKIEEKVITTVLDTTLNVIQHYSVV